MLVLLALLFSSVLAAPATTEDHQLEIIQVTWAEGKHLVMPNTKIVKTKLNIKVGELFCSNST